MRITLAFNLRTDDSPEEAEFLTQEDVDRIAAALEKAGHDVTPVEVTAAAPEIVERLVQSRPELVFNVAEGKEGRVREAFYPSVYEQLGLPHTGGGASLLFVDLDKRLTEKILAVHGIRVPRGAFITRERGDIPEDAEYPLIVKPNFEGSSKGIHQDSVVPDEAAARARIDALLGEYPDGVLVEEFITGRELTVPMLEAFPGRLLEIVEHAVEQIGAEGDGGSDGHNLFDYALKRGEADDRRIVVHCPPELEPGLRGEVLGAADRVFQVMPCPDLGRVDLRVREDGRVYLIEINPLPSLHPEASLMIAARTRGLSYEEVLERVVRSAALRYGLSLAPRRQRVVHPGDRQAIRAHDVVTGRFPTGPNNDLTDVHGVRVGYVTRVEDEVPVPGSPSARGTVRTGITAVVPGGDSLFDNHLVAGGFVLNGIGEMSGLIQAMEWGWMETPILLTNTMSTGLVQYGIIQWMLAKYPHLGEKVDVVIPLVGETNDGFLTETRLSSNTPDLAIEAIENATEGPLEQGSIGGGTGMITFDFAGGTGSASRKLPASEGGYTVGVLVQSNFGKLRNLTVDGMVVGRALDAMFPMEGRRGRSYGSVVVVVATDAPLLSQQLSRLSKRAALGLGRVGSYAASTSGEIVFAFSTANQTSRVAKERAGRLDIAFVPDERINGLYEAVVEATEEAVLNAIFYSRGMTGRLGRYAPPVPTDSVLQLLEGGRKLRRKTEAEAEAEVKEQAHRPG